MRLVLPILGSIFLPLCGVVAQNTVTVEDILVGAHQDAVVYLQEEHVGVVRQIDPRLPWVDRVQLRTQTNRFEWERQRYSARVSVNGIGEMRAERRYQQANLFVAETRHRTLLHAALAERYALLLDYRQALHEHDLYQRLAAVYDDKFRVLQTLVAHGADTDVDDVIRAEYDRDEALLRLAEAAQKIQRLLEYIRVLAPNFSEADAVDTSGFLQPEQILVLAAGIPDAGHARPDLLEKTAKVARVEAEYLAEKARSHQMLDFVQIRHDNRPNEPLRRDLAVGIGLNLPYRGTSVYKMAELRIEQHALETIVQQEQAEHARRMREVRQQLSALEIRRQQALAQAGNSQAAFTLDQAASGTPGSPMAVLRAQELQLKRGLRVLEIESAMYGQYLNLLDWSGMLSGEPVVNYLSGKPR